MKKFKNTSSAQLWILLKGLTCAEVGSFLLATRLVTNSAILIVLTVYTWHVFNNKKRIFGIFLSGSFDREWAF